MELSSTSFITSSIGQREDQLGNICLQDPLEPTTGENSASNETLNEFKQVLREEKRRILAGMKHKTIFSKIFIILDKFADILFQLSIPQLTDEGEFRGHTPLMPLSAMLTLVLLTRCTIIFIKLGT